MGLLGTSSHVQDRLITLGNRMFLWKQSHPAQKLQISFSQDLSPIGGSMFQDVWTLLFPPPSLQFCLCQSSSSHSLNIGCQLLMPQFICSHGLPVLTRTLLIAQSTATPFSPCQGIKHWQLIEPIITSLNKILCQPLTKAKQLYCYFGVFMFFYELSQIHKNILLAILSQYLQSMILHNQVMSCQTQFAVLVMRSLQFNTLLVFQLNNYCCFSYLPVLFFFFFFRICLEGSSNC